MVRTMLTLGCVLAVLAIAAPAQAGCPGCDKVAKQGEGFCCGKGEIYGVQLTSEKLYKAVAGKEVDASSFKCAGCKTAHKESGTCSHCKVAMANGKMYRSPVSHILAKGTPTAAEKVGACSSCTTAHKDDGFCTACGVGFVSGRAFEGKESYDAALAAHTTLAKSAKIAKKCTECAVAMVTDGTCDSCKVSFKGGKKTG